MEKIRPVISSGWRRIIEYPDNHLNDFCLFRGYDRRWHCIGIMGTGKWISETSLFHSSCSELLGHYENHEPLLYDLKEGPTTNTAPQKHAPYVVLKDNLYYLFFRRPQGTNLLLRSDNLFKWPARPEVVFEEKDARDACIQKFGETYYWYFCQWADVDGCGRSCIRLRRSRDLEKWSSPVSVHVDTSRKVGHSHLESPFVIETSGEYWLFVRDRSMDDRCVTTVFNSGRPDLFRSGKHAWNFELPGIHAPELVNTDGNWYIARVSGPPDSLPCAPRRGGWIEIAKIDFTSSET
jgi:hypothetical protein